tara:strand:- start:239 stop:739 length:501 start_codon:yes stop_codon:yes gene_type:complete
MKNLLAHILVVGTLVGTIAVSTYVASCDEETPVAKLDELEVRYDFVANDEPTWEYTGDEEVSDSSDESYYEDTIDPVSTTVSVDSAIVVYSELIVIEAETFGQAFALARYQLGPHQEFVWEANGIKYTTNFAEEEVEKEGYTPGHYWTEAEVESGTTVDSTLIFKD